MDEERRGQRRGVVKKQGDSAEVVRYIDAHVNVY